MADTPINILLNGKCILQYFESVSIKFVEGTFCNSIDLSIKSMALWKDFDPIKYFGKLVLKVYIGSVIYKFLIEERNTTVSIPGVAFTVWGRTAQALLDIPYAKTIYDVSDTKDLSDPTNLTTDQNPWQYMDMSVGDIISYIMPYAEIAVADGVSIHWNVEDYMVYLGSFSVNGESPIQIISKLVDVLGAEIIPNNDGSLTVQYYSIEKKTSIQEYNDLDHIVSLNDDIIYPKGYNFVRVMGYQEPTGNSPTIIPELLPDDLPGWVTGFNRTVRCYFWHSNSGGKLLTVPTNNPALPKGNSSSLVASCVGGYSVESTSGILQQKEDVLLVFGQGTIKYPDISGSTQITPTIGGIALTANKGNPDLQKGNPNLSGGSSAIPVLFKEINYASYYKDFVVTSELRDNSKKGVIVFCFADGSANATMEFEYYSAEEYLTANVDIILEADESLNGSGDLLSGNYFHYLVYGNWKDYTKKFFNSVYGTCETNPSINAYITEQIIFNEGKGTLTYPFNGGGTYNWLSQKGSGRIQFQKDQNIVSIPLNTEYPSAIAIISYSYSKSKGRSFVPVDYPDGDFYVHLQRINGALLSVSKRVKNVMIGTKNILIVIKDFTSEITLEGVDVYVDGAFAGTTTTSGSLFLQKIAVGNHTIKITKQGYLSSDADVLANESFVVD